MEAGEITILNHLPDLVLAVVHGMCGTPGADRRGDACGRRAALGPLLSQPPGGRPLDRTYTHPAAPCCVRHGHTEERRGGRRTLWDDERECGNEEEEKSEGERVGAEGRDGTGNAVG